MVLNNDQCIASKLMIRTILSHSLTDSDDLTRAMKIVDELYEKYPFRMEIYYNLKNRLQNEFDIDKFTFYFMILPEIYKLFQTGLAHLDMFVISEKCDNNPSL